jgi:DNA polymerase-2
MADRTGWFLEVYDDPRDGVVVWLLAEDGQRLRLHQAFPVTFYAAGPSQRLKAIKSYLEAQTATVTLAETEKRDLFRSCPVPVMAIEVKQAAAQPALFKQLSRRFPDVTYYNADIPLALHYAAVYNTFPLAHCEVNTAEDGVIRRLAVLDTPWDLDPLIPGVRVLSLVLDVDPFHALPVEMAIRINSEEHFAYRLPLRPHRPFLVNLRAILQRHDPDVLLTTWGDTWLLPRLLELSQRLHISLPLNREPGRGLAYRPERSYFTYGQVIHRGQQLTLFGRWHIDCYNAMLFHDYGLQGILELARVTALPVQTVARVSPGTGISAMQILTALRQDILVPWHKQQAESPKTTMDLLHADQGGLVYQPLVGLHKDVAEVDFISMYPSIMARFNISPETVGKSAPGARMVPALGIPVDQERQGLVPQTLDPLLKKRLEIKMQLAALPHWDPRRVAYKARASAHKWLLVTCFGYLGYKNARFGRIEAHEAVTAYGRELLLTAKEAAEDMGCTVLHLYVDGMWVCRNGASTVVDFQPLLDEIASRTGLSITLEGIYRWVAFLPSRMDNRVPVANRYFGVFQDGSLKVRGIEAKRRDTPPFIVQMQMDILGYFAQAPDSAQLIERLPDALSIVRRSLYRLRNYQIPLEKMLVCQKLSRTLEEYHSPSPVARAVAQLEAIGRKIQPGQQIRFLYILDKAGVVAWDLPIAPDPHKLDIARYTELLVRAAATIFQPFGVSESTLRDWLFSNAGYGSRPGKLPEQSPAPMFTTLSSNRLSMTSMTVSGL